MDEEFLSQGLTQPSEEMAYKRKRSSKRSKSRVSWKKRPVKRFRGGGQAKYLSRKRSVRRVQRIALGLFEQKRLFYPLAKTELYHNTGAAGIVAFWNLNGTGAMPSHGMTDADRIGDNIFVTGYSIKLLLGQKQDRPNVTFKIMVVEAPASNYTNTYSNIFVANTGNCLLDTVNTERYRVKYSKTIHKKWDGDVGKECTFPVKIWIPDGKFYRFRASNDKNHDNDYLSVIIMAYDAYGSLLTDNIAYFQGGQVTYFRDS